MQLDEKKGFIILSVLLIVGMLASLFLVYEHFSPEASKWCTFGENVNCGVVNKSPYANIDGIFYLLVVDYGLPVPFIYFHDTNAVLDLLTSNAFLGFLTMLLLFAMLIYWRKKKDFFFIKADKIKKYMLGILIFGVLYGLFLFYIQHAILKTYCPFCIALDFSLISSTAVAFMLPEVKT